MRWSNCECRGWGWFWASEICGWQGKPHKRLVCRRCGHPTILQRLIYWWYGYMSNDQVYHEPFRPKVPEI